MKAVIKMNVDVEIKTLSVSAGVRYWEDATVDGVEDTEGDLIPCRNGDRWEPEIDVDSGVITNWKKGVKASIHYKVCDDGIYILKDEAGKEIAKREDYVPDCMSIGDSGYGDYIIMIVDENGKIEGWEPDFEDIANPND